MEPIAFTVTHKNILRALITPCGVSKAYDPSSGQPMPPIKQFNAVWDTGATNSVISASVAQALGLTPFTFVQVCHAQGRSNVNAYMVNIVLPNNVVMQSVKVSEGVIEGYDVLIGMDIIGVGDFAVTHKNGGTVFSFQVPSTHEYDFVKQIQHQKENATLKRKHK